MSAWTQDVQTVAELMGTVGHSKATLAESAFGNAGGPAQGRVDQAIRVIRVYSRMMVDHIKVPTKDGNGTRHEALYSIHPGDIRRFLAMVRAQQKAAQPTGD